MKTSLLAILLVLAAAVGAQSPATAVGTAPATIVIQPYISIALQSNSPLNLDVENGASSASAYVGYLVASNKAFCVSLSPVTPPSGYTGSGTFSAQSSIQNGPAGPSTPGTLTVSVSGVANLDTPGTYTGGSVTITVTQQ